MNEEMSNDEFEAEIRRRRLLKQMQGGSVLSEDAMRNSIAKKQMKELEALLIEQDTRQLAEQINTLSAAANASTMSVTEFTEAVSRFEATISPSTRASEPQQPTIRDTPGYALQVILMHIASQPTPEARLTEAGVWITKLTNGITEITREDGED